jgi:hypothetical protein
MLKRRKPVPVLIAILLLFVVVLSGCSQNHDISGEERQSIIAAAVSYQTEGDVYNADSYEFVKLA